MLTLTLRKEDMLSIKYIFISTLGKSNESAKTGFGAAASKLAEPQEMPPAGSTPKTPHLQPKA